MVQTGCSTGQTPVETVPAAYAGAPESGNTDNRAVTGQSCLINMALRLLQ